MQIDVPIHLVFRLILAIVIIPQFTVPRPCRRIQVLVRGFYIFLKLLAHVYYCCQMPLSQSNNVGFILVSFIFSKSNRRLNSCNIVLARR
jgi:hypothetical protein